MFGHGESSEVQTRWITSRNKAGLPVDPPADEGHLAQVEDVAVCRGRHRRRLRGCHDDVIGRPGLDVDVEKSVAGGQGQSGNPAMHLDQVVHAETKIGSCGLYYKHVTIVNDDSSVVSEQSL